MIVSLALSASVDVTYEVDALKLGGITRPTSVTRVAGGKALNVARVAHALGAPVRVVAALGGFSGEWIASELAAEGVDATVIPLQATTRTCTAIVEISTAASSSTAATTSTDVYELATALSEQEWRAFADAVDVLPWDWVVVSGALPPGVPAGELAELLRSQPGRVIVDSSGEGLRALVSVADVVKVNLDEASELLGLAGVAAADACRELLARFGVHSIVTDGVRGGAALTPDGEFALAAPATVGRFPVGSGDAFLGGLLAALDGGWESALAAASDAAQRNALTPGPGRLLVE